MHGRASGGVLTAIDALAETPEGVNDVEVLAGDSDIEGRPEVQVTELQVAAGLRQLHKDKGTSGLGSPVEGSLVAAVKEVRVRAGG